MADDKPGFETTDEESVTQIQSDNGPADETTYSKAVNQIRNNIRDAARNRVHIYSFNIPEDTLKKAYALLDKEPERRSMKVTFSFSHNFVIRYMPSIVHDATAIGWNNALTFALNNLTTTPRPSPPGCFGVGGPSIYVGSRQRQSDAGIGLAPGKPSVVLEVGDSESLFQLKIDARLWLEHIPEVRLVFLILIDPPCPSHPTTPRITVQLWKGRATTRPLRAGAPAHQREVFMVLEADWSLNATPVYVLLSDVFGAHPVHAAYGNNDRAVLDTAWLRDLIIQSYS